MVQPITVQEIDEGIASIHPSKAQGLDGFNSFFFHKFWHIIKKDIYEACLLFFEHGKLLKSLNCTAISLVPKVPNPVHVKEYRPISCANVLYKVIAKVLAGRMQKKIAKVVDNLLLTTELIKGYSRSHVSPQCMIKIDLRKAYDSVEWSFVESMIQHLGFHGRYVEWVMECILTISYSVMVNGKASKPFEARKGLRQGRSNVFIPICSRDGVSLEESSNFT